MYKFYTEGSNPSYSGSFLIGLREYLATKKPKYVEILQSTKTLSEEAESLLRAGIDEYTEEFLSTVKS